MELENMYQGVLKGTISLNVDALYGVKVVTNAEIDKLFTDRGLLRKGEKPASSAATDADIDKLFTDRGLLKKGQN